MHQAGPSPNNRTLMVLLSHYARLGEYEQIQELWSNLFESASIPKASDYYRVLFLCYGRIGGGYVRTLWDKLKQEKIWIDRELFKILRDIAVHYKMKTFEKDLEKTWEKLIELHNSHIERKCTQLRRSNERKTSTLAFFCVKSSSHLRRHVLDQMQTVSH